jgi:hypothetical protein
MRKPGDIDKAAREAARRCCPHGSDEAEARGAVNRRDPGVRWESVAERRIREAMERGEFDDLEGLGRPIADLDQPYDELWWVKKLCQREGIAWVPPAKEAKLSNRSREALMRARMRGRPR